MIELRPFDSLGAANHGWLDARHHFSFAGYHDPDRHNWGRLRVWNHAPARVPFAPHLLWMFVHQDKALEDSANEQYVPDLMKDKTVMFFEKFWFPILLATAAGLYACGGLPMLLWGVCVRMVFAYHSTWFVNSATHLWGYRNYQTTDESRNLWWVAIMAYGEGWHNNHHAHPRIARAGHRWFEFDPTWLAIKALRAVGLATDVVDRLPERA